MAIIAFEGIETRLLIKDSEFEYIIDSSKDISEESSIFCGAKELTVS